MSKRACWNMPTSSVIVTKWSRTGRRALAIFATPGLGRRREGDRALREQRSEEAAVLVRDVRPGHLPSETVGAPLGARPQVAIVEERFHRAGDRRGIAELHEEAAAVRQQFLGVQVGRRDDSLAET